MSFSKGTSTKLFPLLLFIDGYRNHNTITISKTKFFNKILKYILFMKLFCTKWTNLHIIITSLVVKDGCKTPHIQNWYIYNILKEKNPGKFPSNVFFFLELGFLEQDNMRITTVNVTVFDCPPLFSDVSSNLNGVRSRS